MMVIIIIIKKPPSGHHAIVDLVAALDPDETLVARKDKKQTLEEIA